MDEIEKALTWHEAMEEKSAELSSKETSAIETIDDKPSSFRFIERPDLLIVEKKDLVLRGGEDSE